MRETVAGLTPAARATSRSVFRFIVFLKYAHYRQTAKHPSISDLALSGPENLHVVDPSFCVVSGSNSTIYEIFIQDEETFHCVSGVIGVYSSFTDWNRASPREWLLKSPYPPAFAHLRPAVSTGKTSARNGALETGRDHRLVSGGRNKSVNANSHSRQRDYVPDERFLDHPRSHLTRLRGRIDLTKDNYVFTP
jgi:hypothetical protein